MPLFIVGLVLFLAGFIPLIMALNMYFWPSVSGEIMYTEMEKVERDGDGSPYIDYCPEITYSYTVSGTNYENDVYSTDTLLGNYNSFYCDDDMETTMEFLKAYPAGNLVDVHYDPGNPAVSYIYFEWLCLMGLIIIAVGLVFFGLGLKAVLDDRYD